MGDSFKISVLLGLGACMLLAFQNCGEMATQGILAEQNSASLNECLITNCANPEELLWMKIREYDPYRLNLVDVVDPQRGVVITVGGRCGASIFANHRFKWTLREAFGANNDIRSGFSQNTCDNGAFSLPIDWGARIPVANERYNLIVELVGFDDDTGEELTNPMPANNATLDIIFE